jgi:predicted lipid-binding transport protein (Tim44 family)
MIFGKKGIMTLIAVLSLGLMAEMVDAKPGRGGGAGNRGSRSDTAVPSTPTAPRTTAPTPGQPSAIPGRPANPAMGAAQAAQPSRMSTMAKGFAMGLIGAGLFGLLTGNGLFGGLSGLMGFLGLLLQVALIAIAVRLIWGFIKSRQQQPAMAGGAPRMPQPDTGGAAQPQGYAQPAGYQPQPAERPRTDNVGIGPQDYAAFEGILKNLMASYGQGDIGGIRRVTTSDVASHFGRELAENHSRGLVNQLGEAQLLQGDLAESWYEDSTAYATVAMRFAMTDAMVERSSGRLVSGDLNTPSESVEIWTFRRDGAAQPWVLAGIQQT